MAGRAVIVLGVGAMGSEERMFGGARRVEAWATQPRAGSRDGVHGVGDSAMRLTSLANLAEYNFGPADSLGSVRLPAWLAADVVVAGLRGHSRRDAAGDGQPQKTARARSDAAREHPVVGAGDAEAATRPPQAAVERRS